MNNYEGMFIVNPQLADEETEKVIAAIQDEIKKNNGEVVETKNMGRQQLAYPIKKYREGCYLLLNFRGEGALIGKILSKYRINENILRNLILERSKMADVAQVGKDVTPNLK